MVELILKVKTILNNILKVPMFPPWAFADMTSWWRHVTDVDSSGWAKGYGTHMKHGRKHGGNMGTFSILFRMVLRSTPPIFSFLLFFSKLDQKMSQFYWTTGRRIPAGDAVHCWHGQRNTARICPTQWLLELLDRSESSSAVHRPLKGVPNSVSDWVQVRVVRRQHVRLNERDVFASRIRQGVLGDDIWLWRPHHQ